MTQNNNTKERFIERMGIIAQNDGLPRIAGRLMGLLVLEGGPFSFSELAERLKVSRGSTSTNARLLENMGVIERTAIAGDRQDYYQLAKDPYTKLLQGLAYRMKGAETLVLETQKALPKDDSQDRLQDLGDFYSGMIGAYQQIIESMKDGE